MITIYKGDDTAFADLNAITITIKTELDITGFTGRFSFLGINKDFTTAEVATKSVTFSYTNEETASFCPGRNTGTFYLYDNHTPVRQAAVMKVLVDVKLHRCVASGSAQQIDIEIENVYDYNKLANKPTINGVSVSGEKTAHDFGIANLSDIVSGGSVLDGYYYNGKFYSDAAHTKEITGASNKIYIDLTTNTQYRWDANTTVYVKISASIEVDDALDGTSTNPVQNKVIKGALDTLTAAVATKANLANLKGAFADPSSVKLSPASIKEYLVTLYNAIQALST